MLHINTFSVVDLFSAVCLGGMSIALLYRYWRVTKRSEDALLAWVLFFLLFYCIGSFAADNIVPSGTPASSVPHAASHTLLLYRLMYVAATFTIVGIAHFALRYCESKYLQGWRAVRLYIGGLLICPIFWSGNFLHALEEPRSLTSSWLCAVPWQPGSSFLVPAFLAFWLAGNVFVQFLFWGRFRSNGQKTPGNLGSSMVWTGITLWGLDGAVTMVLAAFGYAGVDPSPPIFVVSTLLLAIGLGEEYTQHERERLHVTRRFKSYVDPALVKYVIEHPEHEHFASEVREMTVVFTDLEGFSALSEKLREGVVPLLNEYLKVMTPLIREHNGYRSKWLGDGMMFFYGAPEKNPDHAVHAVTTVLKMQERMQKFNDSLTQMKLSLGEEWPPLAMRTGVSTGRMIVGDAGPNDASDYTAIGASVNLGARLESANKPLGTRILLSEQTVGLLPPDRFLVRPVGKLKVVGMARAEMVYEPLAHFDEATGQQKRYAQLTSEMVECFRKADFTGCLAAEKQMALEIGPSKLGEVYRQLCQQNLLNSPKAGFAGEIVLSSK